jgi:ParB-like chromosome segregation protein Spo0J
MKWLGAKVIQLDTVKLPAGFAKRKKEPHVKELARSIEASGVIALPVVRAKPRELVAGGDRLAALMLLGIARHEVRLVEGTDAELEAVTLEENLCRRRGDDYDAMTARLVEITTGKVEAEELPASLADNSGEEPRKPGRPKTAKGIAREEVAKATGRTPEAVRQAEKRAKTEEADAPLDVPMPAPVDTFDLDLPDQVVNDWFPRVRVAQEVLRDADRKIAGVLRRLTSDLKNGSDIVVAAYSRTYQAVHDAADAIRRAMPESVCPWCKAQLYLTPSCSGCGETGFVSLSTLEGISPELLERGARAKVPDGKGGFKGLGGPPPAVARKPAKGARKVRIEDEEGNELVAEEPIF